MSEILVERERWDRLSESMQQRVREALRASGIMTDGDFIVAANDLKPVGINPKRYENHHDHPDHCVEACWLAAEMAYRTCVASGGMGVACEVAMDQTYSHCMKGCK